jgi:hypothetical protein
MNRLLLTETMDPDGAMYRWCSPDVESLGWDVLRIPTQELIHHLGIEAYNAFLRSIIRYWKPHMFMVHPPYDYLIEGTVKAAQKVGTRMVAYGFDDPLFFNHLETKGDFARWSQDINQSFDLYASTSEEAVQRLHAHGMKRACQIPFATSPHPFEIGSTGVPPSGTLEDTAVIVGRPYDKRLALVEELLEQDVPVSVFGHGWSGVGDTPEGLTLHGPLEREAMNAVYASAGVVITTGDWEDVRVPMVKYRLLEVAMVGGFQVAQESPDLHRYFPEGMVPTYTEGADLAVTIKKFLALPDRRRFMAQAAQAHAQANHRWETRFPELLGELDGANRSLRDEEVTTAPAGYRSMLMFLGHLHEENGSRRLAHELFSEVVSRFPSDVAAQHGKARCEAHWNRHTEAAFHLEAAMEGLKASDPITARGVFMSYPRGSRPLGLGETGYLHPRAELSARSILALSQTGKAEDAKRVIDSLNDPDLQVAVMAILKVPRLPNTPEVWLQLITQALEAAPPQLAHVQATERAHWEAEARRLQAQIQGES